VRKLKNNMKVETVPNSPLEFQFVFGIESDKGEGDFLKKAKKKSEI